MDVIKTFGICLAIGIGLAIFDYLVYMRAAAFYREDYKYKLPLPRIIVIIAIYLYLIFMYITNDINNPSMIKLAILGFLGLIYFAVSQFSFEKARKETQESSGDDY